MANIIINGVVISGPCQNVVVCDNKITVNGKDVTPNSKEISITVNGDVVKLVADTCQTIVVIGNADDVKTASGDVTVGGDIKGSVSTVSGAVDCNGNIAGSVSTVSGSVKHRR